MKSVYIMLASLLLAFEGNTQSNFTVNKENTSTVLKWQTPQELNNKSFFVERSNDGKTYQRIGTVMQGSSDYNFQFVDATPQDGSNYYRIQHIDENGKPYYSTVKKINIMLKPLEVKVYPNPIKDMANLSINSSANEQVKVLMRIIDNSGHIVWQQHNYLAQGINNLNITANTWPAGTYHLNVSAEGSVYANTPLMKL